MALIGGFPSSIRLRQSNGAAKPDRLVVYGPSRNSHAPALAPDSAIWTGVEGVGEVVVAHSLIDLLQLGFAQGRQSIVLPMRERYLKNCPRLFWGLMPSRRAVAICHDKRRFAVFAREHGLGELIPKSFVSADGRFPVVIKRRRLANGSGVALVRSAEELAALRQRAPWAGHRLLVQETIEGSIDCVTHCVVRRGRMVWQSTYQYLIDAREGVQRPSTILGRRRCQLSRADQEQLERFLAALDYDGPAVFDYRRTADGRIKVLEINARFGGSLFRPENADDLGAALRALVAHAVPPPWLAALG